MYGTIARLQVKPGKLDDLRQLGMEEGDLNVYPGIRFQHIYQSEGNENEVWMVVAFSSRDTYRKNAESPEQAARYEQFRSFLDADPEWHDGEVIDSRTA